MPPTEGLLRVDGQPVAFAAPKDASRLGISMVFQETSLVPQFTVAQNMVLGREHAFNSVRKVRNEARQVLQRLNFNVDPSQLAGVAVRRQTPDGRDRSSRAQRCPRHYPRRTDRSADA